MTPLLGMSLAELTEVAKQNGLPAFTGKQMAKWIYGKRVVEIDEMTNISLAGRQRLKSAYCIGREAPGWSATSADGTVKYLFRMPSAPVEAVYIPDQDRATLCVSCQVGCKMNCLFCMTGKQGWQANLSATEIMNQILSIPDSDRLTNIVFMGMGEPFDNTLSILRACEIMTSDWGMAWSPRRITVSTAGLVPGMKQFLEKTECHLAVSLHNPFPSERIKVMPSEKVYSIVRVIDELKRYDWEHQRRVSFEYIVFEGFNDGQRHATEIVRLLKGFTCRVNLIKFHPVPGIDLHSPADDRIVWMRDYLTDNGITTTIRRSRGLDIMAACGLLSSNHKR